MSERISSIITQVRELLPLMPKGKWGQFHPHHHEEAKGAAFREWDTTHDLSAFDGETRTRVATFKHVLVAAGYHKKIGKFWEAALWPMQVGKLIACAVRRGGV